MTDNIHSKYMCMYYFESCGFVYSCNKLKLCQKNLSGILKLEVTEKY